jgi:PAS domain S-box-containing protein
MLISDITEMDRVRSKLDLLANLVENAEYDMIFIVRPEGQIMECNGLARRSFGYSQSEMLSLNIGSLFKSGADGEWENIAASVEKDSHWRGELLAISKDRTEFPVEITVSRPVSKVNRTSNMICFARDITERKHLQQQEVERKLAEERIERMERELRSLVQLSDTSKTAITAKIFGVVPLRDGFPNIFHELVDSYKELMELALEQQTYRVEHDISGRLNAMAETLGFYRAGPRDVVDIHTTALKEKTKDAPSEKRIAYAGEGRIMVLEFMGYLASFYRNRAGSAGIRANPGIEEKDETIKYKEDRK